MRIRDFNEGNHGRAEGRIFIGHKKSRSVVDIAGKPQKAEKAEKAEKAAEEPEVLTEDVVELSGESRKSIIDGLEDMGSYYSRLSEELARAREQGDGMAEMMKEKIMCVRIAMRIISGNKVPKKDHKYLMEKDPELYARANMMKLQNKDRKKLDRLTEDEEDESKVEGEGESRRESTAPAAEAAPAESGGDVSGEAGAGGGEAAPAAAEPA